MICFAKYSVLFRPQNRELPYQEFKFCPKGLLNARVIQLQDWKGHQKTTLLWHPIRRSPNTFCISNAQHFWCWCWWWCVYVWCEYVLCKTVDLSLCLLVNCLSRWSLYYWLFVLIIQSHHHSNRVPSTGIAMYNVSTCGINMFCTTLLMLMMIYPCVYVWYKLVASLSTCAKKLFIKSPSEKAPPSTKKKKTKDEANNVTTFFSIKE